jgi:hypothetical protein
MLSCKLEYPVVKHMLTALIQYVRKVAVHLYKVLEVMSTSVYTGLKAFNFIRKHFMQICLCFTGTALQPLFNN